MTGHETSAEFFTARKAAEEYRSKGYEVSIEPLLDFLPGYRADLVARREDETVVVEVETRSSLAANYQIVELASIIDSKPGWRLELLMVPEPERLDPPKGAQPFEHGEILQRVEEAERSLEAGFSEAAYVLAWSACEAAIRELIAEEGTSNTDITQPGYVLHQAIFLGVISRDEYHRLNDLRKYRNAIVHGFSADGLSDELVTDLISTTRRMIKARARRPADPGRGSTS